MPELPDNTNAPAVSSKDEALLKEIRETFTEYCDFWQPIWEQYDLDMRALSNEGPMDPKDRDARIKATLPCIHIDLLTPNIDQVEGEALQNPRGIEVTPEDNDADEKTAEHTENRLRAIANECHANDAQLTAFGTALRGGIGAWMVRTKYKKGSFEQEFDIERIIDPKTVVPYPYCKKADWSDQRKSFKFTTFTHAEFRTKFGDKSQFKSFEASHIAQSGRFVTNKTVIVAEYWKIKETPGKVYLLDDGSPEGITVRGKALKAIGGNIVKDTVEFPERKLPTLPILKQRDEPEEQVCQYLSNGLEILDETEWLGSIIPIIFITGTVKAQDNGLMTDSLIRKGRDPQLLYDYACMKEAEALRRISQSPYIAYKGQLVGDEWKIAHLVPLAFLEAEPTVEGAPPGVVLPLPQRNDQEPATAAINISKQASKQDVQDAIGMASAHRREQIAKDSSGTALKEVKASSDVGTYRFFFNYNNGIILQNRILEEMLPSVENTPRKTAFTDKQGKTTHKHLMKDTYKTTDGQERPYSFAKGRHTVTLTTGPSHESQRKEAEDFAETLAGAPDFTKNPLSPLIIKLRRLGPVGDEMEDVAKAVQPPEVQAIYNKDKPEDPRTLQVMAQAKQQMAQMNEHAKQLEQKIIELEDAQNAKTAELASKEKIANAQMEVDKAIEQIKSDTARYIAELNNSTKKQVVHEELTVKENLADHAADQAQQSQDRQLSHAADSQDKQLTAEERAREDALETAEP